MSGFALLLRLVGASLRAQAQYPASAIMLTIGHFLITAIEIVAVWALFDRFGAVRGWEFGEGAVFYGLAHVMFSIADIATRGFDLLGTELIRTGDFDRVLLRPRAATLLLVAHDFRLSRLGRFAQGLVVLLVGASAAGIDWTLGSAALTLWAGAGGVALFCGIMIVQGAVSFWTREPRSRQRADLRRRASGAIPARSLRALAAPLLDLRRTARLRRVLSGRHLARPARSARRAELARLRVASGGVCVPRTVVRRVARRRAALLLDGKLRRRHGPP
jgi:ABC-type uncharacterized transport system permease subunit